jgi:hypothetical protein
MHFTTRFVRTLAVGALTLTLGASLAAAQGGLNPTGEPNFGTLSLSAGFEPDPFIVTMISGGDVDASSLNLGDSCRGFMTAQPDFRLTWDGAASLLRFYFAGEGDTTLVVSGPDGQTLCNDDGFGLDPLVEIQNPAAGDYNIWVGSYSQEEFISGYLMLSGQPGGISAPIQSDVLAAAVSGGGSIGSQVSIGELDPNAQATFGVTTLAPGFTPDPFSMNILSGGSVNTAMLSLGAGCVGYAASAPDFSVTLAGTMPQLNVGFTSSDAKDTTLIVRGPSGEYLCNDDTNGVDPELTLTNAAAGEYDIWVGTYSDDFSNGTLYISQAGSVPSNGAMPVTGATSVPPAANATPEATGK